MKRIIIVFFIFPLITFAQYPAPTNFEYSYDYILIGDWGVCGGEYIEGASYCSHFVWNVPDTIGLSTNLEYYNIYLLDYINNNNISIIATLTDTTYDCELGVIGEVWVTAVYSNPDGTSEPSNIEVNTDLPLLVETNKNFNVKVNYNRDFKIIKFKNSDLIKKFKIFNSNGILIKSINYPIHEICISDFPIGMYIIEIVTDNYVFKKKIIK